MSASAESIERRLVVYSAWLAVVFSMVGVLTNWSLGGSALLIWACAASALGFALLPLAARRGASTPRVAAGFLLTLAFLLASTWEANGGIRGSTSSTFAGALVFSLLTLPSRMAVPAIIGVTLFFLLLCVVELWDGVPASLPFVGMDGAWDMMITTTFTATFCGVGVAIMRRSYEANLRQLQAAKTHIEVMAETAIAADREKTHFLARMSHDLRTPLTAVLGSLEVAGRDDSLSPALSALLSSARQRCFDLERMVADLLDVGLVEVGALSRVDATVALAPLLQSLAETARPRPGVRFSTSLDPALPTWVCLDGTRAAQAVANLLGNACKHTDQGEITLSLVAADDRLCFVVKDSGPGIAAPDLARLGQAFVQLERGRQRGGVGLGLFNAQRIAALLDGQLRLESTPGRGSCATLEVPLRPASPVSAPSETIPTGRGLSVLVADDDPVLREVLQAMLEKLGCAVVVVENGAEALEMATASAFDVVLLDMHMPVMDGPSAAREIRRLRPGQRLVSLTANAYPADMQRCFEAGVDCFLSKPVTLAQLSAAVFAPVAIEGGS